MASFVKREIMRATRVASSALAAGPSLAYFLMMEAASGLMALTCLPPLPFA